MKYNIINVNSSLGLNIKGCEYGPFLINKYINSDCISGRINIYPVDGQSCINNINMVNKKLFNSVIDSYKGGSFPIILGGDHSLSIGSALASLNYYHSVGIIWIDAHADFNTFETTETGNIHGLPLACICGYHNDVLRIYDDYIDPKKCVVLGARAIDKLEDQNILDAGISMINNDYVKQNGIKDSLNKAFELLKDTDYIHISFDVDVIDPTIAMGVSVPEYNGISDKDAYTIIEMIKNNPKVVSLDIVEFNPLNDINGKTKLLVTNLINNFIKK